MRFNSGPAMCGNAIGNCLKKIHLSELVLSLSYCFLLKTHYVQFFNGKCFVRKRKAVADLGYIAQNSVKQAMF